MTQVNVKLCQSRSKTAFNTHKESRPIFLPTQPDPYKINDPK